MNARADRLDPSIDPITLEVIKNALSSIADEMALVLMRSAYSPVVRDSMDVPYVIRARIEGRAPR